MLTCSKTFKAKSVFVCQSDAFLRIMYSNCITLTHVFGLFSSLRSAQDSRTREEEKREVHKWFLQPFQSSTPSPSYSHSSPHPLSSEGKQRWKEDRKHLYFFFYCMLSFFSQRMQDIKMFSDTPMNLKLNKLLQNLKEWIVIGSQKIGFHTEYSYRVFEIRALGVGVEPGRIIKGMY